MASRNQMTTAEVARESLGDMATDQDVAEYRAALERILPAFPSLSRADDWLFGNGDYLSRIGADACAYCGCIQVDGSAVPAVDDDEAWRALDVQHNADCEWIATRAHRINVHTTTVEQAGLVDGEEATR